jgi:hypothetical protein
MGNRHSTAKDEVRCLYTVTYGGKLKGDLWQCRRAKKVGDYCKQHAKNHSKTNN